MERDKINSCKRCLLADYAPEEYLEHMRIYLKGLSDDSKSDVVLYQERLNICRECSFLLEGVCRKCGCFVEYRAALIEKHCPDLSQRW
ncbi:MAG TPA: DUF6171 family protein [Mobilitalea sp.]|nr:DUF6171 family protein [Mobilitalea sp.]